MNIFSKCCHTLLQQDASIAPVKLNMYRDLLSSNFGVVLDYLSMRAIFALQPVLEDHSLIIWNAPIIATCSKSCLESGCYLFVGNIYNDSLDLCTDFHSPPRTIRPAQVFEELISDASALGSRLATPLSGDTMLALSACSVSSFREQHCRYISKALLPADLVRIR